MSTGHVSTTGCTGTRRNSCRISAGRLPEVPRFVDVLLPAWIRSGGQCRDPLHQFRSVGPSASGVRSMAVFIASSSAERKYQGHRRRRAQHRRCRSLHFRIPTQRRFRQLDVRNFRSLDRSGPLHSGNLPPARKASGGAEFGFRSIRCAGFLSVRRRDPFQLCGWICPGIGNCTDLHGTRPLEQQITVLYSGHVSTHNPTGLRRSKHIRRKWRSGGIRKQHPLPV